MSWRTVVISSSAKLDYQMGYLIVRREDVLRIHLGEIRLLLIETTAVSLTAVLLSELTKHKVKVIFCDEKRNPSSQLLPFYGAHDTSSKIRSQMQWSASIKAMIWTEIVSEKIRNQAEHLTDIGRVTESKMLNQYVAEMALGDETNREGHAAKVYFNALFGKAFTRTEENSTNAALNYGYSLILSCFTREVVANGYITQVGLFHDNMFNQFNLASDLMEPFRILVDRMVYRMKPQVFEKDEKHEMLNILQEEVTISERKELVTNAISIYTRSVFDALNDSDPSLIHFYSI